MPSKEKYSAEKAKELSAIEVKRITRPGRHAAGNIPGLLLVVKDSGAKSWILRTVVGGRCRNIGLGGYPEVSLADAREKARETKKLIEQGFDPVEQRRRIRFLKYLESARQQQGLPIGGK